MDNLLLEFEYGSKAHGTDNEDSDSDIMGIYLEEPGFVTGIFTAETQERKTAIRGERSTKLDVDGVYYPLRKWAALAAKGNPTVLTTFFVSDYRVKTISGSFLVDEVEAFLSKDAIRSHLGYMKSQREALLGTRNKKTNRPELVHKYGMDTKFAYHMIRLGVAGVELARFGNIELPLTNASELSEIRDGKLTKAEVLDWSDDLERVLEKELLTSFLPEHANVTRINRVLHEIYMEEWR